MAIICIQVVVYTHSIYNCDGQLFPRMALLGTRSASYSLFTFFTVDVLAI